MRVILVGSPRARAKLRAQVNGSLALAGESPDLAAAREHRTEADAFLVDAEAILPPEGGSHNRTEENHVASAFRRKEFTEALTEREREVLELLAEGLSNKGIAQRLGISDQTAKFHVASIAGKLGARNRTEAVRLALRQGLITL
jgi:DNA-binding NarL/FixJ family response regulator